ncbi:MAG TPA: ABC-2 transporter permease [Candidatus Blautia intestinavium]|nr:ABC-2 transporter permease [Candidatus Blautia intestinavium]
MKGLLRKDLALVAVNAKTYLVVLFFVAVWMFTTVKGGEISYFGSIYMIVVFGFVGLGTITSDEQNGAVGFLMTLPVKRSDYVKEKYLLCIMYIVCGWALSVILAAVIYRERIFSGDEPFVIFSILYMLAAVILVFLMIPINFRFGTEVARIVLFGVFAAIVLGVVAGLYLLEKIIPDHSYFDKIAETINAVTAGQLLLGFLAVLAVEGVLSYLYSLRVIKRKEF